MTPRPLSKPKPNERELRARSYRFDTRLEAIGVQTHMFLFEGTGRVSLSFDELEALLSAAEAARGGTR